MENKLVANRNIFPTEIKNLRVPRLRKLSAGMKENRISAGKKKHNCFAHVVRVSSAFHIGFLENAQLL